MRVIPGLLLFTISPLLLSGADPDPFLGKWKLNWDKSHSQGAAPKSAVRKYSRFHDGVHVSEKWIDLGGKHQQIDYKANYDGKEYAIPASKGHTVAFTKTDPFTVEGVSKTDGKVDYTFRRIVSPDRKTLTIELAKRDAAGAPAPEVLVYDKVK
jgi:hypothetical protein